MRRETSYLVNLLFVLCFVPCSFVNASYRITIATIGGGGEMVNAGNNMEPQKMVAQMIEYWKAELNKVLPSQPDLILLPEDCDHPGGLTTEVLFNYYKVRKNQLLDFFASTAKANHCYIVFIMKMEKNGTWWNSCILLDRIGEIAGIYNKNFPTIDELEEGIKASKETQVFQCDFRCVACAICFDLNFDELREKYPMLNPDIILFPSMYHGGLDQCMWANSCMSFFVCFCGVLTAPSEIRNPLGEVIVSTTN